MLRSRYARGAHADALAALQAELDAEKAAGQEKAAALEGAQAEIEKLRGELAAAQEQLAAGDGPIAVMLAPTRELALQIKAECDKFGASSQIKNTAVYGGVPKGPQQRDLQNQTKHNIIMAVLFRRRLLFIHHASAPLFRL